MVSYRKSSLKKKTLKRMTLLVWGKILSETLWKASTHKIREGIVKVNLRSVENFGNGTKN